MVLGKMDYSDYDSSSMYSDESVSFFSPFKISAFVLL